jgi:hypothetical protein
MKGIEIDLIRLLDIQTLSSISLKGSSKYQLDDKLVPFIQAIESHPNISNLDITGNHSGPKGIDALTHLIQNSETLHYLEYDRQKLNDITPLIHLFDALSASTSIFFSPFPANEIYRLVSKASKSTHTEIFETISRQYTKMQFKMMENLEANGVHSFLATKGDLYLDKIIAEKTFEIVNRLHAHPVNIHSAISILLSLPFPFQAKKNDTTIETYEIHSEKNEEAETYDRPESVHLIVEVVDQSLQDFQTIQYNSLRIVQPDADRGQLQQKETPAIPSFYVESDVETDPQRQSGHLR